jgi:hypothetical protein
MAHGVSRLNAPAPAVPGRLRAGAAHAALERHADDAARAVTQGDGPAPQPLARATATATAAGNVAAPPAAAGAQRALASAGQPLDTTSRQFFEPRFGHDFSRVRVHADGAAEQSARALAAHAYTVGPHIAFARGQYAPHTGAGRQLLAHELAHVVQQDGGATLLQRDEDEAERKKQEAARDEARKRLETWAQGKASPPSTKPTDKSFAFTAQERAFEITHDKSFNLLPKPTDKKLVAGWRAAFRDAYQLALMILDSSGTDQREERAGLIGVDLATAGFTTEAMAIAARLPAEKQKHIFEEVVKAPASASAAQIRTISTFSVGDAAGLGDHLLLAALTDRSGAYAKLLGKDRLLAALEPTLAKYRAEPDYVEALAEILVFHRDGRVPLSEWLWKTDKAFLFEILQTKYFVEPGYGPAQFADAAGTARELTMADDMPWVYTYKQKYYVELLVALGAKHAIEIKAPKDLRFATLRAWLEAQTAHIGQALAAEYPEAPDQITQAYARIADIFFFHVDRGDVTPDLAGHLGALGPADPSGMRLKSDCDVLATYATRLLRGAGFTPVGYLAVLPGVGDGHAVALLKRTQPGKPETKDTPAQPAVQTHYIVNNKQVKPIAVKTKEEGIQAALADALLIYSGTPESYRVFYEDAAADGAMTRDLWTTVERVHRRDLDKTATASPP